MLVLNGSTAPVGRRRRSTAGTATRCPRVPIRSLCGVAV